MPLEPLQCPSCGSPLQVEASAGVVFCSYCGSRLRITRGASGHAMGVLDDIKADTAIIARQTAVTHLEQQLAALCARRDALVQEQARLAVLAATRPPDDARLRGPAGWTLVVLAAFIFIAGLSTRDSQQICITVSIVAAVTGFMMQRLAKAQILDAQALADTGRHRLEQLKPALADAEEVVRSTQARIDQLKAEMDRLAREL